MTLSRLGVSQRNLALTKERFRTRMHSPTWVFIVHSIVSRLTISAFGAIAVFVLAISGSAISCKASETQASVDSLDPPDACALLFGRPNEGTGLDEKQCAPCGSKPCIQCDEDRSGPVFKIVAGRTRRNSGLPNAICRPCSEVQPLVHDYR